MARNKARAWSNLKGRIPDDPEQVELTERMKQVLARKDERTDLTMADLAQEWGALEEEEAFEAAAASDRNITYDALQRRILEELERVKEIAGTDMWRGEGHTFSPKYRLNIHVGDPEALRRWITEKALEHMLTLPQGRLAAIVGEAMNTDLAATLTPAERASLKPGEPGSGQPPPGVSVSLHTTVHHTSSKRRNTPLPEPDGEPGPF